MILPGTFENVQLVAQTLMTGEVAAFPTETVYGLGALYDNERALQKIFALKKRAATNPLIVHGDCIEKLSLIVDISSLTSFQKQSLNTLSLFWPGPLSIILPSKDSVSSTLRAGHTSVAFRIPSHPIALSLIQATNSLIAAPSANISKRVSPTCAAHVNEEFGDSLLILDGGACEKGLESTVVSLMNDKIKILRPGSITAEMLSDSLKCSIESLNAIDDSITTSSPGHEKLHYAPNTPLYFIGCAPSELRKKITLYLSTPADIPSSEHIILSNTSNEAEAAAKLYGTLREIDKMGFDAIEIEKPSSSGIGTALLDRLNRAQS